MDTLVPEIAVTLGGRDIRDIGRLDRFLTSVNVSLGRDKTRPSKQNGGAGENVRSTATLSFSNIDGQLWDVVRMRQGVEIRIGYRGSSKYTRGRFVVTKPVFQLPQSGDMVVQLFVEDYGAAMVQDTRPRNVVGWTIGDVVKQVAGDHHLRHRVDPDIALLPAGNRGVKRPGTHTDWKFLEHLVHEAGPHLMFVDSTTTPGEAPVLVVERLLARPLKLARTKTTLSLGYRAVADYPLLAVQLDMRGLEATEITGSTVSATTGSLLALPLPSGGSTVIATASGDAASANADDSLDNAAPAGASSVVAVPDGVFSISEFARAVALWNVFKVRLRLTVSPGLPFVYPGHVINLRGAGPFSGDVLVTMVEDIFGTGGYSQTIVASAPITEDSASSEAMHGSGSTLLALTLPNGAATVVRTAIADGGNSGDPATLVADEDDN